MANWPLLGTTDSFLVPASSSQDRIATDSRMTMLARVMANAPLPIRGCQKSATPGVSYVEPSAARATMLT